MLRVILVDDEEPVLNLMERRLALMGNIEIAGRFTQPREAVESMKQEQVDVVFLDIQMPGMNGLEVAEYLVEVNPNVDVVFVTAYNEYAIEAFELNAVDYLLKPPTASRLSKTIERLLWRRDARNGEERKDERRAEKDDERVGPGFRCFGQFEWIVDAQTGESVNWKRYKDRELMAYLVHRRNQVVSKASILEHLWPDAAPEQASAFLHTCVYNIRKMMNSLGCEEKLVYKDNGYRLELLKMWCDADEFERIAVGTEVQAGNIAACEAAAALYTGNYMEQEGFIWSYEAMETLKDAYISLMNRMAEYYRSVRNEASALRCLLHAHTRHPFHEDINASILLSYARLGDRPSIIRHYERFTRLMKEELDIEPMESTVQLYQRLCSGSAKDIPMA
ncbi:response regulator [Paenibacillus sp. HB172176]|uniref:response regulator n=1 Tax=Paenibacillus sp. HB172176 TaxID=2493690 RepID=UPI00143AA5D2|nr:response regulator [Paenibacillus sp. HB172176]